MKKDRDLERAQVWLSKAQDDLLWAEDTLEHKRFSGVCFLTQQATEKKPQGISFL